MLRLLLCGVIVGAPCLLILMQPDLGEAIIWGPVLLALLFVGGIPLRYLICILLIVAAASFRSPSISGSSRINRNASPRSSIPKSTSKAPPGRSINRSSPSAPAAGRARDSRRPNTQIELGFLPATAVHNDYIFSAIGEQWGFVGGMFLIGAFAPASFDLSVRGFFRRRSIWASPGHWRHRAHFTHIFQNVGMTISMLPITGVPLPLISYSGSFVLIIMFGLGIVNSVWVHRKEVMLR